MSNSLPEPDFISTAQAKELLRWFNLGNGVNNNERRRTAEKTHQVANLVGKISTEETVLRLEAEWELGRHLTPEETHLLRQHEELLDLDHDY